ncbi:urea amidolyase family protein [Methylopila turkensis]|uniref:Allophanate hydrolase n=1 Tax=Methylopila turkensis TaxID=1437816 RepID=A0A9W6JTI4_9HYPH|nr:urea amidolyase family protein [Methylopila turkensis]GLK81293.1 allophanate hydrolase [Methylopila turkensis]
MRFLPAGSGSMLVELADLDETLALQASLAAAPIADIEEVVAGARTLLLRLRPAAWRDPGRVAAELRARDLTAGARAAGPLVEIPALYDGEDLRAVADHLGVTPEEVVRRHTGSDYHVVFIGFAPGFAYLAGGDPGLNVPRRRSPRTRIPAGSVALAGVFSGVYPKDSPGGWQLIGRTPLEMWDPAREPAALLQPGERVRFRALRDRDDFEATRASVVEPGRRAPKSPEPGATVLTVVEAPLPALFQDLGRPGRAGQGVSASGALDRAALRAANRIVGNEPGRPCIEIAGGIVFTSSGPAVIAVAGAPCAIEIRTADGVPYPTAAYAPLPLAAGDRVALRAPERGVRSYLAARGGFAVEPELGSASTDTLARLGPAPLQAGARLAIGSDRAGPVALHETPAEEPPAPGDVVTLDVVLGPRADWFTAASLALLCDQDWEVTPRSDRVGLRLAGERALDRADPAIELPSEGAVTGAIQVPHDGQPVLFLADHPLTGGYPVIATVAERHLDRAGQIPPGARIRFRALGPFAEIVPTSDRIDA